MKKIDYKWVIAGLCFIMIFTCLGFCSSTKGWFLTPITDAFGMERWKYSLTDTARYITVAIVNVFFSTLVFKFGIKKLIGAGFGALVISMSVFATATEYWHFYVGGAFLGIGFSWTTTTMVGCVVNRWCKENKGTVMGAILAANGLGGAVANKLVQSVIANGEGPLAYRRAYWVIAVIVASVGVLVIIFFKEKPKNLSVPTNGGKSQKKRRGNNWVGISYTKAIKMPYFYLAAVCIMLTGAILQGITSASTAHLNAELSDSSYVAWVTIMHSIFLAAFKFGTGVLYDKCGLRTTVNICTVTAVAVMLMLAFVTNSPLGRIMAMIYGVFSALALPLETIMLPIYAGDLFGEKSFDRVLGVFVSVNSVGYALGSVVINGCYDIFGSYKGVFIACASVMVLIFAALQYVMSKARKQRELVEANS